MRLVILGSGTSTGVPIPGCKCRVCLSSNPRNERLRTSAAVHTNDGATILIDSSTDLRMQALRAGITHVEAVIFTHSHADHILGLDDLRAFNFSQRKSIPCYGTEMTLTDIRKIFSYVFNPSPLYVGGGLPQLTLHEIDGVSPFELHGVTIQPIPLIHGALPVTGYRFGNLAYLTDVNQITPESFAKLAGLKHLILDGLRYEDHKSHYTIPQSIEVARQIGAQHTWLIHMSHTIEHEEVDATLPGGIRLAYDGLELEFEAS